MTDLNKLPWLKYYDKNVPHSLEYPDVPLHQFLRTSAQSFPERAALVFQDQPLSYADLDRLTDSLARWLISWGLEKGDRIGTFMPNIPQFVLVYYAVLKAGGVVVAMNPQYKQRELEFQLKDAGVRLVFGLRDGENLLREVQLATAVEEVITTELGDVRYFQILAKGEKIEAAPGLLDCLQTGSKLDMPLPEISSEDVAIFQYTGGTTGIPKGAVGLHRNLVANTVQFSAWLSGLHQGQEVVLAAIPLFHVYGMVIAMSMGIALGATLVLVPNPRDIPEVLRNIQTYSATLFPGVPNMYAAINQFPDVQAGLYDLRSIKACISGSAPLRKEIKLQFEQLTGGKLLEGYGLSEAPTATHCNPMWGENRTGSIGLPLPDVEAQIVDLEEGNRILAPGEAGELVVRGPQIMQAYHNMPRETIMTLRDGWLHTGDIASMDVDGYFYIIDRKKEMIKVGGLQVWPREVEEVIALHPVVIEAAVAGLPDDLRGEVVKAWVVVQPGEEITEQAVRSWCEQHLAHYKVPRLVEFRQSLPRTMVGKLLRRQLVHEQIDKMS